MTIRTSIFFTLLFAVISLFLISSHEMWRDELQAWILSRDSSSITELFTNLKYEGHPGLWHLMLYPLTRIFETPEAMKYLHILIATTSVFVIMRWSPFTLLQKILLCFSYFLFFEYTIISRNYAIGVLLIFLVCAIFPIRKKYPILIACILFLLSHSSILGLIFAISLFVTILFEEILFLSPNAENSEKYSILLNIIAIIVALLGFITSIIQLIPPGDSGIVIGWNFQPSLDNLMRLYAALFGAYFPLPNLSLFFWNSKLLLSNTVIAVFTIPILVILVYSISRYLFLKPAALFFYLVVSTGLLLFFYTKFSGSIRHHGFLFIALIAALWIYSYCGIKKIDKSLTFLKPFSNRTIKPLISLVLLVHLFASLIAGYIDFKYPFSGAKETAEFLKQSNLVNTEIIGYPSPPASAVAGYIPNKKFYYPDAKRYGTYIKWDKSFSNKVDLNYLISISRKFKMQNKNVVLILNRKVDDFVDTRDNEFELIFESSVSTVSDETFYVYSYSKQIIKN